MRTSGATDIATSAHASSSRPLRCGRHATRHRFATDQHVHARDARRGPRRDPWLVHVAGVRVLTRLAGRRPALPEVLRPVLPLLPAAGAAAPEPFSDRDAAAAVGLRHRRASRAGARASADSCRKPSASTRVAARRCAASSRTPSARSALNRIPTGGNALLVLNNELRFPLVRHRGRRGFRGHRQRVRPSVGFLVHRPSRDRRRRGAGANAMVPDCAATTGWCSTSGLASGAAASISASARHSRGQLSRYELVTVSRSAATSRLQEVGAGGRVRAGSRGYSVRPWATNRPAL